MDGPYVWPDPHVNAQLIPALFELLCIMVFSSVIKRQYRLNVLGLLFFYYPSTASVSRVTAFSSYGVVFQPLDPSSVPTLDPNNATILTLCELWENDSIPVTPGIEVALQRIRPHFAQKNIGFRLLRKLIPAGCADDSILAVSPALVNMHFNESKTGCSLIIGPSCTETMYNIRGLAMGWNVPVVTSGASGIKFEEKKRTTVLTRFGYTQEDVASFTVRILDNFNWSSVIMISDADSNAQDFQLAFQRLLQSSRLDLYKKIDYVQILSGLMLNSDTQYLDNVMAKLSDKIRIMVIAAMPYVVYQILEAADRQGMTTSEYVYVTTNLIETRSHGFADMTYFDGKAKADPNARRLLDNLLVIRMQRPNENEATIDITDSAKSAEQEFSQFSDAIKTISRQQYNYTYAVGEEVTHLVLGIWDAVMFYALAVNATIFAGGSPYAGRSVTSRIWGHSFMGIGIECTISQYGDRNFPYYVLDYSTVQESFQPVILFDNEQLRIVNLKQIHWPGDGLIPPADIPRCGFNGKALLCQTAAMPVYGTILLTIMCLGIVFGIVGVAAYRAKLIRVNDDSWRIKGIEIIPREPRPTKGGSSRSLTKADDAKTLPSSTKDSRMSTISYVPTAFYKENIVAVKDLGVQTVHLPTQMLFELRTLRQMVSEHIARFYGLCLDTEVPCILMEHCPKGSLTDLIENESVNLDWSFKFSLLNDISDGLLYIHNSVFKSHGRITSNNCLIDGRFVVKISDLGLTALRPSTTSLQKCTQINYPEMNHALRILLWRAPELLRIPMPANGTPKGDIYSIGIIIQQLAQRRGPYERVDADFGQPDVSEIVTRVRDCLIPPFRPRVPFDAAPPELFSIMLRCWSELPADRFDSNQLRIQLRRIPGNKSGNLMDNLLQRMEKYAKDLEDLVNERTSAFMDEKKRSEELLYQMLPRAVANKLKQGMYVEPEAFESVTIYFSDIVGFTTLCASSTPMEVVDLLNDLYTIFDGIIEGHDVYKVETIGDAYVVVSGLPQRNDQRHCNEIAYMSLHVIAAIKAFKIRHKPNDKLTLRIGMHTGPCAAGVVGLKMPRYCIFGDSVNIASRLESTSEAMKIHVSAASKSILQDCPDFKLEFRGSVDLKGRGTMETYWLHAKSDLDLDHFKANNKTTIKTT